MWAAALGTFLLFAILFASRLQFISPWPVAGGGELPANADASADAGAGASAGAGATRRGGPQSRARASSVDVVCTVGVKLLGRTLLVGAGNV